MFLIISPDGGAGSAGSIPAGSGPEGEERDSLALLDQILGGLSTEDDDFSREWTEVFGDSEEALSPAPGGAGEVPPAQTGASFFLPSQLLDQSLSSLQSGQSDPEASPQTPLS